MIPPDLGMAFDEALKNELGQPFRNAHYNLVSMSTGDQFAATPAIILYVHQKASLNLINLITLQLV